MTEHEIHEVCTALNCRYEGEQYLLDGTSASMITDMETGTSFCVRSFADLPDKLAAKREQFAEAI